MAGESRPPGRSRPASGTSSDISDDVTAPQTDPSMAPITANTPLPPLTPLPLPSQSGGGSAAPHHPEEMSMPPDNQSALPPPPPPTAYAPEPTFADVAAPRVADSGVTTGWAARTTFALMLTSAVLLAAMAIAYTAATKQIGPMIWIVVIIVLVNIIYPALVFSMARPGPAGRMRLPFLNSRRAP